MPVEFTKVKPDSLTTILRQWLARKLDVGPEPGTFWCVGCSLQGGRTLIQYADRLDLIKEHLVFHPPGDHVHIRSAVTPEVEAFQDGSSWKESKF